MSICFYTTYIGTDELKNISDNFPTLKNADYYLITNLQNYKNNCWNVLSIDISSYPINNSIRLSRYIKFLGFQIIQEQTNKSYDYYFYNDSYLFPNININWKNICKKYNNAHLEILQYEHPKNKSLFQEMNNIFTIKKDTKKNIDDTRIYLQKINPTISLKTKQLFENTVFGYKNTKNVKNYIKHFWNYYEKSPSYRDQITWNFLYLHNNVKPIIDNRLRKYYKGKNNHRNISYYQKNNDIFI